MLNGTSLDYSLACSVICIDYDFIKGFKFPGLPACGLPPVGGLPYSSLGPYRIIQPIFTLLSGGAVIVSVPFC